MFTGREDLNLQAQLRIIEVFRRQMNLVSASCTKIFEHNFLSASLIQKNLHCMWFIFSVGCYM